VGFPVASDGIRQSVFSSWVEDLGKKPTDMVAPLLCLLEIFTNRLGSIGFGKPYGHTYFSGLAFFASIFIGVKYPGLWDWMMMMIATSVPLVLGCVYIRNGLKYGEDQDAY
jgi:hypothetical protein